MGQLFGTEIDIDDPLFELTSDDPTIARQMAMIALDTPPGFLDAFPEYGFEFRNVILQGVTPTELAMLPLEVRGALEQEPAFVSAEVVATPTTGAGTTVSIDLACTITAADGTSIGFTPSA